MDSVSGKTFPTINPVTEEKICDVAEGDKVYYSTLYMLWSILFLSFNFLFLCFIFIIYYTLYNVYKFTINKE